VTCHNSSDRSRLGFQHQNYVALVSGVGDPLNLGGGRVLWREFKGNTQKVGGLGSG